MPEQPVHEPFWLVLRARPTTPLQRHPDYDLILNGKVVGEVYYNMTGYVGTLPQADGTGFTPGKTGISAYRAEVARINRGAWERSTWRGKRCRTFLPAKP
jgi:hypothetical protein